ncbi:MAG: 3-oxoacyl-acyl-carrier protein reductase [bacterium]|nr:MAG: 3-oxoacyl-acyl-carrier protein reductase [bacterium]
MSDLTFTGRTVLVTGAAGDIGGAIAGAFSDRGASVFGLDRMAGNDGRIGWRVGDVTVSSQVDESVASVAAESGRLDIVVAAAGITRDGVVWKLSDDDWRGVMAVNLDGSFHLIRAAVPRLREQGGGSIVLIASINGERGKAGQANYAASKAGLVGLARSTAREVGRFGIRVNVVAPGFIDTAMTRPLPDDIRRKAETETALGHIGRPDDVAGAVLFLCSGLARHITGQLLRVDGGQYM